MKCHGQHFSCATCQSVPSRPSNSRPQLSNRVSLRDRAIVVLWCLVQMINLTTSSVNVVLIALANEHSGIYQTGWISIRSISVNKSVRARQVDARDGVRQRWRSRHLWFGDFARGVRPFAEDGQGWRVVLQQSF